MDAPRSKDLIEAFRDGFVVRVVADEGWGTGVLLAPRVVATCRHVVEDPPRGPVDEREVLEQVDVHRGERSVGATVLALPRRDLYDDVALLLLDEPLDEEDAPYPRLVSGMTRDLGNELVALLGERPGELLACGANLPTAKIASVTIEGHEVAGAGTIDWYQLGQGQPKGRSGGPVWLAPSAMGSDSETEWGAGVVLGLVAQGANTTTSGGPPHAFAVGSDTIRALRTQLVDEGTSVPAVTDVDARTVVERVRSAQASRVETPRRWPLMAVLAIAVLGLGVGGVAWLGRGQEPEPEPEASFPDVIACSFRVEGEKEIGKGWAMELDSGTVHEVEVKGRVISFRCPPEGCDVAVVVDLHTGELRYWPKLTATQQRQPTIDLADSLPGAPPRFVEQGIVDPSRLAPAVAGSTSGSESTTGSDTDGEESTTQAETTATDSGDTTGDPSPEAAARPKTRASSDSVKASDAANIRKLKKLMKQCADPGTPVHFTIKESGVLAPGKSGGWGSCIILKGHEARLRFEGRKKPRTLEFKVR